MIIPSQDPLEDIAMRFWWPVLLGGCIFIVGGMVIGLKAWRSSHFPHSIATITEVWDVQVRIGKHSWASDLVFEPTYRTITMAKIQFTRTYREKSYDCTQSVDLGSPSDKYKVGDKLDVVPATGTCQRVDIVGRVQ
jgi:hypothetical protein